MVTFFKTLRDLVGLFECFIDYIFKQYKHVMYTLKHKIAFLECEMKYRKRITIRGLFHDTDKLLMYLLLIPKVKVSIIHHKLAKHHILERDKLTTKILEDKFIDYACARLTKADKPLSAWETVYTIYPQHMDLFKPIFNKWGEG